jgi:hypothetical protein
MNTVLKPILISVILFYSQLSFACPCGLDYKYYYVVIASSAQKEDVLKKASSLAKVLGDKFISDESIHLKTRIQNCGEPFSNCIVLLNSEEEPLGKVESTAREKDQTKTYAAVYAFQSYNTKNNKIETALKLKQIKKHVRDAYVKTFDACACE